ncbi:RimJ/RimL family protein N-acetyltransferase [Streptomyces afghaniensis]|nr:RimJ/RimL family protein N-acetyltransferase [Streptomyces afghaniensis]
MLLGRVALREMRLGDGTAEVAYWTAPAARGRGVAARATTALDQWALDETGFHRLQLLHAVRNEASCRVASRAGFTLEGTKRSAILHPDGWRPGPGRRPPRVPEAGRATDPRHTDRHTGTPHTPRPGG